MKKTLLNVRSLMLAVLIATVLACLCVLSSVGVSADRDVKEDAEVRITADETVVLVPGNDFVIIYSADSYQNDATVSYDLATEFLNSGVFINVAPDVAMKEGKNEILIGATNRPLSEELIAACIKEKKSDELVWGFAYKDGKFAFAAANEESFERGAKDLFEKYVVNSTLTVPTELWETVTLSREDYNAELKAEQDRIEAEKEAARQKRIDELKAAIDDFEYSDFSDHVTLDFTVMPDGTNLWGKPQLYPYEGEHPRVNVTRDLIEKIKTYIETTEEGDILYKKLLAIADTEYSGILEAPYQHETGRIGFHNVDEKGLAIIEAKAFVYLLTGDEIYAYEAILAMKNYLDTFVLGYIYSDQCREFGRTLFCVAEVYDWCYYLLDEEDKNQFMIAATHIASGNASEYYGGAYKGLCQSGDDYIEVGYPPAAQSSVAGHGAEAQILRDYLSISIAIFDENPSWYNYVAARLYNDFIPFRNYYFTSGTYPQGVNNYAPHRHNSDVWSAWLFLCATGENPYTDDFVRIVNSMYEHETPGGEFFGSGDGARHEKQSSGIMQSATVISALYADKGMRDRFHAYYNYNMEKVPGTSIVLSLAHHVIFGATYYSKTGTTEGEYLNANRDVIIYHDYPIGQYIARYEWQNENAPAIFLKIGEKSTSNHDHADQGTFQIFYKGLYSGESGVYDKYGSNHWRYYHQGTVAHNGLLIFDPTLADYEVIGTSAATATNASRVFYSGGQRHFFSGFSDLESWVANTSCNTATVLGHQSALNKDGTADYVYLAGDISQSYLSTQASYVGRNMFTLFTGAEDIPMFFAVYDSITAANENLVNKFLLHTQAEPVIDEENKTVSVVAEGGRLVLHSLVGADKFEALGGEGQSYLINGIDNTPSKGTDGMWGRLEISNTGKINTGFFNVMYVTDADSEAKITPNMFENDLLIGTEFGENVIAFTKSGDRNADELTFTTEGSGIRRYFILGMYEGTWNISVDGVSVAHSVSSVDGGMISFYAPSGNVTVSPGKDIAPSNGGRIIYNAFGGIVPDDAPQTYEIGIPVKLPETIKRGEDIFLGWFTSPTFEEETRVTELNPTEKGRVEVYAKYKAFIIIENYDVTDFAFGEANKTFKSITYKGNLKKGSWYEVHTDPVTGNRYASASRTEKDMQIDVDSSLYQYMPAGETKVTFEVDLAKDGDKIPMSSSFMLRENTTSQRVTLFGVTTAGAVTFGGTTLFMLNNNFQKVVVTVDFGTGTLVAYNEWGDVVAEREMIIPAAASTQDPMKWLTVLGNVFNWWMGGGESILIDNFRIYTGAYEAPKSEFPEGTNRILYQTGVGSLPADAPTTYTVGETVLLPDPEVPANTVFLGWYATETFDPSSKITEITASDANEPFTVYAKYSVIIFMDDFTGSTVDVKNESVTVNDILYQLSQKEDSYAKAETDAHGNTYIKVYTNLKDATLNNNLSGASFASMGGGKITYELSLAKHSDGRVGTTSFKPRGLNGPNDSINIFSTTTSGAVNLNGKSSLPVGNLTTEFTRFIFTLDIFEETVSAYNEYGVKISSVKVSVPSVSTAANVADWFASTTFLFNWHMSAEGGILVDEIKIYSGEYVPSSEILPENSNLIIYNTGKGSLPGGTPSIYKVGETVKLPVLTAPNAVFGGWYTTPEFAPGTEITEITAESADEPITVYAKFNAIIFEQDFSESTVDTLETTVIADGFSYGVGDKAGSAVKAQSDANGNKYIKVTTTEKDATINVTNKSFGAEVLSAGGVVTYEISLATQPDGKISASSFKPRGGAGAADSLVIFKTDVNGNLMLGGTATSIATLSPKLTKFVFTLDVYAETLTAYNERGDVLSTVDVAVPTVSQATYASISEWIVSVIYAINFQISAGGGLLFDDVKIYTGAYLAPVEELPEGTNRIIYEIGNAVLEGAPEYYTAGTSVTLPIPNRQGSTFLGWYTSPTFEKESLVTEIKADNADRPITVYARFNTLAFSQDFTGSTTYADDSANKNADGLSYVINGKTGAYVKAVTDEGGNTYLAVYTDETDGTVNNMTKISGSLPEGKVTYEIDLALFSEEKAATSSFSLRATSTRDAITLFKVEADGTVTLRSDATKPIAKLGSEFTKIIITLDAVNATVTAYSEAGETLATADLVPPEASGMTDFTEWFKTTTSAFNWWVSYGSAFLIDNVRIIYGEYVVA